MRGRALSGEWGVPTGRPRPGTEVSELHTQQLVLAQTPEVPATPLSTPAPGSPGTGQSLDAPAPTCAHLQAVAPVPSASGTRELFKSQSFPPSLNQ